MSARQESKRFYQKPHFDADEELLYEQRFADEVRERVRLLLPIMVAIYLAFLGWDYWLDPQTLKGTLPLRASWALIALAACGATYSRFFSRVHQALLFVVVASAGAILVIVIDLLPMGLAYGAEGVLLVVLFAAFLRLRPRPAAIAFLAIAFMLGLTMESSAVPRVVMAVHGLHFVSASLVALAYTYLAEVWSRQNFLLQRQLTRERDRSASLLEDVRSAREERVSWLERMGHFLRHELKNQLIGIQTSVGMLRGRTDSTEGTRFVERAERSAKVMSRIIEAATEATSLEGALQNIEAEDLDLAAISEGYAHDAALARPDRVIHFSSECTAKVRGDEARLIQMLEKIVQNAIDHAPEGGRVEIRAGSDDGVAWVRVENDGDAIASDGEEFFEPFASFRSGPVRRGDNLGLGLYVARQIARAHGGDVGVVRPLAHSGAAFEVRIPRPS